LLSGWHSPTVFFSWPKKDWKWLDWYILHLYSRSWGISIEFKFQRECCCHDCLQPVHLCVKVIRWWWWWWLLFLLFRLSVLFWDFCRATREDSILLQAHPIVKRLLKRSRAIVIAKKNSQIGRLLKIEIKSLDKNHTHFYFQFIS
jgi:hypothetical protein